MNKEGVRASGIYHTQKRVLPRQSECHQIEKNGIKSCRDRSRNINIKYFCIKDILSREEIEVKHRSTELMIVDYLTKPA